jgi:hypothetical protein
MLISRLFNDAVSVWDCTALIVERLVNDQLGRVKKEALLTCLSPVLATKGYIVTQTD